jgi:hypothetical protein
MLSHVRPTSCQVQPTTPRRRYGSETVDQTITQTGGPTPVPTVTRVPNQPKTPKRGARIADDLWRAAQRVAADRGETLTDVIRRALEQYVREHPEHPE